VNYLYGNIYRLTSESISCATTTIGCSRGSISHPYNPVGDRTEQSGRRDDPAMIKVKRTGRVETGVFDVRVN